MKRWPLLCSELYLILCYNIHGPIWSRDVGYILLMSGFHSLHADHSALAPLNGRLHPVKQKRGLKSQVESGITDKWVPHKVGLINAHPVVEFGHNRVGVAVRVAEGLVHVDNNIINAVLRVHSCALANHDGH